MFFIPGQSSDLCFFQKRLCKCWRLITFQLRLLVINPTVLSRLFTPNCLSISRFNWLPAKQEPQTVTLIGWAVKPQPHERFFACAGDAIFSNFVASPARGENRTCSHPRTCNATGEKIARKKSPELKFSPQNRRDSARVTTLQLSVVIHNSSGNAGIDWNFHQKLMVKSLFLSLCEPRKDPRWPFLNFLLPSFAFYRQEEECK